MVKIPDKIRKVLDFLGNNFSGTTIALSIPSVIGSMIYASLTAIAAVISRSLWLGFMTFFYVIMVMMSLTVLGNAGRSLFSRRKRYTPEENYKRFCYRLIVFDIVFGITVLFFHFYGLHKEYPGYTIYITAVYVFVKVYFAVLNLFKAHRSRSLTALSLRQINAVKAIVSLLILQNALLSRFGNPHKDFTRNFNSVSGAASFLFILLMGLIGLIRVKKRRTS